DLGGFASVDLGGRRIIKKGVFAAYVGLEVNIDVGGLIISGAADFKINTGSDPKTVFDATGTPINPPIPGNTYKVTITADIDFFGVLDADGSVEIGVEDGIFSIEVDASMDFFGLADVDISGFINSNGSFNLSGNLGLDLTYSGFGIEGGIGVTLKDTGISGHGSVGLVLFGQSINIASASFNFNWQEGIYRIRAEGPLGIWLEVTVDVNDWSNWSINGGLGVFDVVFDAIGDAAVAVGEAVAEAAEAVAGAFVDLGEAILDFGEDVIDFFEGVFTDLYNLAKDIIGEIASWFSSSKTVVYDLNWNILTKDTDLSAFITPTYSYSTDLSDEILTITNLSASQLCLAIVNVDGIDKLIVDAPDTTESVPIAIKAHYTRYFRWKWGFIPLGWSSWSLHCWDFIEREITFSNMFSVDASDVSKIVIHGINSSETIILDRDSISIDTDVYGYGGDDVIVTGQGNDRVWGGNGDDTILTYEGNDYLYGENGDDKLMSGTGNDVAYGGSGEDLLDESYGRASDDTIISETNALYGGSENDIILGSPGNDTIEGGAGEDLLIGDGGLVTLGAGSGGNDIIDGGADDDTLFGLKGEDILLGGGGDDDLYGDEGDDYLEGGSGNDWLFGGADNDILDGGADNDTLYGQQGEDILLGGNGDDFLYGDTDVSGTETVGNILLGDGGVITIVDGLVTEISTTGQEAGGTDTIYGNGGADIVMGGAAMDMIYGDAGDDILLGDTGIIVLDNGSLVSVNTEDETIGGSDTIHGDMGNDIIIGGLNSSSDILYGSAGDDIILGDNGFLDFSIDGDPLTLDLIRSATDGLGGNDVIYGNAGDDVLIGGTGGDSIDGNEGKDLILGDNGVLTYMNGDTSNPRFRVLEGAVIYGETPGVNDGLPLIDRDYQFNDPAGIPQWAGWEVTLSFNSGGADYIAGGPDNDQIFGQGSNDIIQGDGNIDPLTDVNAYRGAEGLLVVSPSVEDPSDGDDYIEGNDGDDIIFGNLGQDDIIGGSSGLFGLDTAERTDGE
ncbi:MAG: calcium-binding protein, partial [Planctomycetota bacterium]